MNPSELSDDELNRAIAEELPNYIYEPDNQGAQFFHPACWKQKQESAPWKEVELPNWSGDIAAAMGLMTEKDWQYNINNGYVSIYPHTEQFWHNNTIEGIARAISEAWYSVRRNE